MLLLFFFFVFLRPRFPLFFSSSFRPCPLGCCPSRGRLAPRTCRRRYDDTIHAHVRVPVSGAVCDPPLVKTISPDTLCFLLLYYRLLLLLLLRAHGKLYTWAASRAVIVTITTTTTTTIINGTIAGSNIIVVAQRAHHGRWCHWRAYTPQ